MRYLGQGDTTVSVDVDTAVEKAPTTGGFVWSIRGFYGVICEQGWISRLGVVWGRS
ncbi:hypothetical protein LTS08_003509 [Lithohypha guttulata]|nr:hypothetical protein LTS08_003509 [Lithohypha guttulata]